MSKKIIVILMLVAFISSACSAESEKQKELARTKKIESLKKECKANEKIEVWKVKSINQIPGGAKEVSLTALDNSDQAKIIVEGFNDLKPDMEVIVKISVNDLSLNQKYGSGSAASKFVTIVGYY